MRKAQTFITLILVCSVLLCSCRLSREKTSKGTPIYSDSAVKCFLEELDNDNIDEAKKIYKDYIKDSSELNEDLQEELISRLESAIDDYNSGDISDSEATVIFETITSLKVLDNSEISSLHGSLTELINSKSAFASAESFFNAGDYYNAYQQYLSVSAEDENYSTAVSQASLSVDSYVASVEEKVQLFKNDNDYVSAINTVREAANLFPNNQSLQTKQTTLETEFLNYTIDNSNRLKNSGNYEDALKLIGEAMGSISDPSLTDAYNNCSDEFVKYAISTAQAKYKPYDIDCLNAAEEIISNALSILPGNTELTNSLNHYKELEPIKFSVFSSAKDQGSFASMDSATDNFENTHSNILYVDDFAYAAYDNDLHYWWYCYKTIDLDFQYSRITGVFFQNEKYSNASTTTQVIVEGYPSGIDTFNGNKLWKGTMSGSTEPLKIDADITGMHYVCLMFQCDYSVGSDNEAYHMAYLADVYVWK